MAKARRKKRSSSGKRARRTTTASRRPTTRRSRPKRKPPQGFASWSAYMASIRPGGTVAKRKSGRKRRSGVARVSTRSRTRRRRGASSSMLRGNGGGVFSVRNIISSQMRGVVSAGTQLAGEVATVSVRQRILPNALPASVGALLTDLAIGTALGMVAQRFIGRNAGQDVITGVYSGALRRTAKGLGIQAVNNVLGAPDGSGARFVNRGGRWVPLSSYVGTGDQRALSGYVGTGDQRSLAGGAPAGSDEIEAELYGA